MIVRIASGREDLPWANGLADHLRTEGFQVADEDDFVELDATVAVLSDGAIGDPKWRTAVEGATGSRLVPVQLHPTEVPDDPDLQEPPNHQLDSTRCRAARGHLPVDSACSA